jgi:DNA-binding transcriptional regulator YiaG
MDTLRDHFVSEPSLSERELFGQAVNDDNEAHSVAEPVVVQEESRGPAPCSCCGKTSFCTRYETLRLKVAGYTFRASQTVLYCLSCCQIQWPPSTVETFRLQIASWLAKRSVQSGHAFKFMRKSLGLKAVELSRLLSLAPETVSRWERGHRQCDARAITLLGTMVMDRLEGHDQTMERLRALQEPAPSHSVVDLTDALRRAPAA